MSTKTAVDAAMRAHTHLNVLESLIAILEAGTVYGGDRSMERAKARIISLAKAEQQRQLDKMDRAVAKALGSDQ